MHAVRRGARAIGTAIGIVTVLQGVGLAAGPAASATTVMTATAAVNVRAGATTASSVVGVLRTGTTVTAISSSNGWTKVSYNGRTAYVYSSYLTAGSVPATPAAVAAPPTAGLPAVTGQVRATAALMIRTTSTAAFTNLGDVPAGTILGVTGVKANGMAQIVYNGAVRWVNAAYVVAVVPAGPAVDTSKLPAVTGVRYATTALDIRNTSADSYTPVAEVPKGTSLSITGTLVNGRMQIVYANAVRWVTAAYLSPNPVIVTGGDSVGLAGLVSSATLLVADCRVRFPKIVTYYGVRPDSSDSDHPTGHAVDLMLPSYTTNAALGQAMADYYRAHASEYGISYIIWNQHIWSVARSGEGWRFMADRGSDTQNHKDHVHVSFR